jgi:hypothetical protein
MPVCSGVESDLNSLEVAAGPYGLFAARKPQFASGSAKLLELDWRAAPLFASRLACQCEHKQPRH